MEKYQPQTLNINTLAAEKDNKKDYTATDKHSSLPPSVFLFLSLSLPPWAY